ncbi:phosphoribosylamine--glycine ligase, chloroplastic-like [Camellia sinensis]|uniref:phosphoribosylamine--glycine ligase, chloroplastic-like n=1 Tax=Camellia sinensis TaxID=4442 RepID=UPI0010365281|nr:phosphoribosylamine--glycine ligase, chloroplastic-like [Camellia sinensis]
MLAPVLFLSLASTLLKDWPSPNAARPEEPFDMNSLVLMVRLESDLAQVLLAACKGELSGVSLNWSSGSAMVVVMASNGYPESYVKGSVIQNLDEAEQAVPSVKIFHAGTALDSDGNFIATGGRVLGVTAKGIDLQEARDGAYQAVEEVNWQGGFYRQDIGWRVLPHKQFSTKT